MRVTRLIGLMLLACSVLMTEVVLTRVFSVVMWYHFAFLAISVSLFGLGLGGMLTHLLEKRLDGREESFLAYAGAALGVANGLAVVVLLGVRLSGLEFDPRSLLMLALVYLVSALPFFAGGIFISLMLRLGHKRAGIVYLFDLIGAGLGCLLTIPLLRLCGGPAAMLVAGALAAVAGIVAAGTYRPVRFAVGVAVSVILLTVVAVHLLGGATMLEPRYIKGQKCPATLAVGWNSFSRVIAFARPQVGDIMMEIDGVAHTPITPFNGNTAVTQTAQANLQRLPYLLHPGGSALIFGSGGGEHILTALDAGAKRIVGLEYNPIIYDWVENRFGKFAGHLFHQPGVQVVVDEGRSYIRRTSERFDLIQFTLIDTWTATAAGAFALSENNVFTFESFQEYFDHLTKGGLIAIKRWSEPEEIALRLMALARAVLEQRGVKTAEDHFFIVRDGEFTNLLIKADPFTLDEVGNLAEWCAKLNLGVAYSPFSKSDGPAFIDLARATDLSAWLAKQKADLSPPTDNHPFLFYTIRLKDLPQVFSQVYSAKIRNIGPVILYALLAVVLFFVAVLILVPAWLTRRRKEKAPRLAVFYFAALGLAYLLVEVAMMQKFILYLGHPTYSLAVVLFTLLLASGVGSAFSQRLYPELGTNQLKAVVVALVLYAAVFLIVSPRLFYETLAYSLPQRIGVSIGLLLPLGLLMGIPFPFGVRKVGFAHPASVPWMFAVNSAASVLGSVAAMILALHFGFPTAITTGLILYLMAGWLL